MGNVAMILYKWFSNSYIIIHILSISSKISFGWGEYHNDLRKMCLGAVRKQAIT